MPGYRHGLYILEQSPGDRLQYRLRVLCLGGPSTAISDADYVKMADVEALRQN